MEAGARLFVETMSSGPGAWDRLPPEMRRTHIANARTFLDETRDAEQLALDLAALARFDRPALLTLGGKSPPFFAPVADRVAAALPRAERHTFARLGHMPQLSDPRAYAATITEFIARAREGWLSTDCRERIKRIRGTVAASFIWFVIPAKAGIQAMRSRRSLL